MVNYQVGVTHYVELVQFKKNFLPICSKSGQLSTFKQKAVKKLIECAVECGDHELHDKLQSILDPQHQLNSIRTVLFIYIKGSNKETCVKEEEGFGS